MGKKKKKNKKKKQKNKTTWEVKINILVGIFTLINLILELIEKFTK
ncbi:hypothetical protein [Romboutsia ilealis]|nr:hypothetical protein [Romboutsia ilealis]